jgi:hypothetical protein
VLFIETRGSWREMGRQIGDAFPEQLRSCIDYYAAWLVADLDRYRPAIAQIRDLISAHVPELIDETAGLAESSGIDEDTLLGYRFFNEVRERISEGCSVVYVANSDVGPILGRNCDLSATFDPDIQLCRTSRPTDGPDRITTTYLGMAGAVGVNASGLGIGGASAHTQSHYGVEGLPGQILNLLLMGRCGCVAEARDLLSRHAFLGKSQVLLTGDRDGASVLFEMAPGRTAEPVDRPPEQDWQICTNFFPSGRIPIDPEPMYLESAYARFGRMSHTLGAVLVERSVSGIQQLLTDIAQPGLCIPQDHVTLQTAYSQVMELATGRMHIRPGHPEDASWQVVALT